MLEENFRDVAHSNQVPRNTVQDDWRTPEASQTTTAPFPSSPAAGQTLDIPERACGEASLFARKAVDMCAFRPRSGEPACLRSIVFSIALIVESHIGSTGLMNLIMGISSAEASKSSVPFACTNDCSRSFQKFVKMSFRISSRVRCHTSRGPESERFCARRRARSKATQHITRECRNSFAPPRTSHIPSSGRRQFFPSHSRMRWTSCHPA